MNNDYKYWYNYRVKLTNNLKKEKNIVYKDNDEKTKAIVKMAKEIGIKPTARYFNIESSSVRYWLNKYK